MSQTTIPSNSIGVERQIYKSLIGICGRQIRKVGRCFGAGLSRGQGVGYGVEEAVVEASSVGTIEGAASATQNEM